MEERADRGIWVIIGALMLALLLAALDQTIVSTALPTIVSDFGGLNHLSWVVTAYLLASTVSAPLWGKLGDQYGRKRLFQLAITVFLVASALCGLALGLPQLIFFRALQGLGGGGLMALAMAIIGDVVSPRDRGRYQGFFGGVFAFASVVGPLIGGLFVDHLSWRWVFYVNLPIGLVALVAITSALPGRTERTSHRIDYRGAAVLTAAVTCVVMLTAWGGAVHAWDSPVIVVLAAVAAGLVALFVQVEHRAAEPVLPPHLFRDGVFTVCALLGFIAGFAMMGSLAYLPLFLQVAHGVSATISGLYLLPLMVGMLGMSITTGQLISRTGYYRGFPILGMAVATAGMLLLHTVDEHTPLALCGVYFFVLGAGLGLVMQVLVIAVQNVVDYRNLGVATSSVVFFRSIGGSFGVSVFGSIFASRLADNVTAALRGQDPPVAFDPTRIQGDPKVLDQLPPELAARLLHAFSESLTTIFLYAAPITLLGFALAWLLRQVPLRTTIGTAACDLGDGYGRPRADSSQAEIERCLSNLMRKDPAAVSLYTDLARRAGYSFSAGTTWVLCRVAREGRIGRAALAERAGYTAEEDTPYVDPLVRRGLIERDGSQLAITGAGLQAAQRIIRIRRAALARHLDGWDPAANPELTDLLTRLATETVGGDQDARPAHSR
ncbi:EmrB/QacA family drug resistance transporter [Acrocarpospora phusangensis]|uniref:EmrB/QacA family drug resistance transporter n=1 Tax=Acrocarpospora phusangensis TaxID=1070424 RepID=A0A919UKK0_9ACTN|nr:MFS transporter [Acrocarpospora phusangensis]GIH25111.1 EmrB/QacA family drug resistance transporter [Acrocarpospora phusangensis]